MENMVQFLADLDLYFLVKNVPDSIRLPLVKKAVFDSYTSQWLNMYKDLTGYELFKQAVTELLWWTQMQATVC
jgi:hypothetical protein